MKLNELKVLGADNKTMIKVYDGDVYYLDSEKWVNFTYYSDANKKRKKTRPYTQWSAMTNRSNVGGKHQEIFSTYSGTVRSELFCNFDSWCDWAENVGGYMCEDSNGMLWELDKDLLGDGSIYSEDTCVFLPRKINGLLKDIKNIKSYILAKSNKWSVCGNDLKRVDFKTLKEAEDFMISRNKKMLLSELFDNFETLDERAIEGIIDKAENLEIESLGEEYYKEKTLSASEINSLKNYIVAFVGGNKKSELNLPEGVCRKEKKSGVKYRVQVSYEGKKYKDSGKMYSTLKEAEIKSYELKLDIASDIMSNRNFESISESYPELVDKMLVKIDLIKHNLFMLESGIF